ncbi:MULTISPECIES: LON peptidase substrate-binding domain-containing protein [Mameliella]|uniref:ATP-dependent protease n=1 Tax=Mameliella alba TaxID=561184 RepID=A0A0B3S841_9RHOB|nr:MULTISPECIES: LON peptidase substrate-binding domain-containing protein [Mameliella]MBV6636562.1 LON peptidase substrate-binding domain-containing protein [Mameliella sp.]MCR9274083.1 LON peptidase substrate-binding domain-containing protein [Paracoccaceae bacterium]ODM48650.1 ATP-dependent protease [Ruegeria sp. PBVC088]KHQ55153.1 ATP-dependent protease [Mameliella alba]MBY6118870.1 LON peptidase substrate-binding domain-containing protein [Mameliella alba]
MTRLKDLPGKIPVFPLPGALLLPRARLPLHIFEPRYLAMLDDCLKTETRLIGMIQPHQVPGREERGLHRIGCAGRVTQFSETEDGRYMITLTGISRFRIVREVEGFTPYRCCEVNWDGFERDQQGAETDTCFERVRFMDLLDRFFAAKDLSADWDTLQQADDELLVNSLSMLLDFNPEDKQALLEAPSLSTRRETLVTLIEYALRGGEEDLIQ